MPQQTFPGNLREGWPIVAVISDPETGDWNVQARPMSDQGWINLKISAVKSAPRKANYVFGWNGQRIAKTSDSESMKENRPSLLNQIIETAKNLKWPEMPVYDVCHVVPLSAHANGPKNVPSTA